MWRESSAPTSRPSREPETGGSDHSVFLAAGVPSVLAWHSVDRFYRASLSGLHRLTATPTAPVADRRCLAISDLDGRIPRRTGEETSTT